MSRRPTGNNDGFTRQFYAESPDNNEQKESSGCFSDLIGWLVCCAAIFYFFGGTSDSGSEKQQALKPSTQVTDVSQKQKNEQQRIEALEQQRIAEEQRRQAEEQKLRQAMAEEQKRQAANAFQYTNMTLSHSYNEILPYNGIKMSFVVQNTSDSVQTLRLSDFVLKKDGSNTILPEKALRGHTGIARNPENPDFSDYENELNQREMYPGDRFFVKIEFWEQRELIKSLEGWHLVQMYQNNTRNIASLHD